MLQLAFTYVLLAAIAAGVIAWATYASDDDQLGLILAVVYISRLSVGVFNSRYGPLPGAEVDAVMYEGFAWDYATQFMNGGGFVVKFGREGYSTLLSIPYILGGRSIMLITFLNAVFVCHGLIMIYRMVAAIATRSQARTAVMLVGFYPSSLLYTSVPTREAPLIWGLMLFVYGMFRWQRGESALANWRIVVGLIVTVWLHAGFVFLAGLPVVFWWYEGVKDGLTFRAAARSLAVVGAFAVLMLAFLRFGGLLPKLPADPTQLLDTDYLAQTRAYKASYGTGYLGFAPSSLLGLFAFVPISALAFLFSPVPGIGGGFEPRDAFKFFDATLSLVMVLLASRSLWLSLRNRARGVEYARLWATIWMFLVLVFAMGTANVGIAIRHRAKFVWLLLVIITVWPPFAHVWRRGAATATPALLGDSAPTQG